MGNPTNVNDSEKIIALLQEQNNTLHSLLNFQMLREKKASHRAILSVFFHAIPYIALVIVGYFVFQSLHGYLEALNNNINTLRDGFISLQTSIGKLIPDFSGIKDSIQNTWQDAQSLFK